jgi:hypothetical protein
MRKLKTMVQVKSTYVGARLRVKQGGAVSGGKCPDGRTPCEAENKGVRTSGYAESACTYGMKYRTPAKGTQKINSSVCGCQVRTALKGDGKYDMPVRVKACADLAARAEALGCRVPGGIAVLPGNFLTARSAAELRYHESVPSVRAAWRSVGLNDDGSGCDAPQLSPGSRASSDRPAHLAVFFGSGLLRRRVECVTLALGMVGAVLAERRGAGVDPMNVRLDAIVERPDRKGYTCLEYRGDVYELVALAKPVREVWAGLSVQDD